MRSRLKKKSGPFTSIPHSVMDSENFRSLGGWDIKLLLDIAYQYRGKNNGDLAATWSMFRKWGWKSKGTLQKSLNALLSRGFIELTRQGGRNRCNLYAITWQPINECKGKLDVSETLRPSNLWKTV